jgi:predicted CXXCH cytochrome family protein
LIYKYINILAYIYISIFNNAMRKIIFIPPSIVFCLIFISISAFAKISSGPCSNCHTMHNSQNGTTMATIMNSTYTGFEIDATPNETLLITDCLGCHSSTVSNEGISSIGAPSVFNTLGPDYGFDDGSNKHGLAGGNFFWVRTDDTKGHNVFPDNPDDNLSDAPGRGGTGCGGAGNPRACHAAIHNSTFPNSFTCHAAIHNSTFPNSFSFGSPRQGCTKCHMISNSDAPKGFHHLDDTGPVIDNEAEGWYRFLTGHDTDEGVSGIEDTDWQATSSSSDHNEYLGYSATKTSAGGFSAMGNTMTGYCTGCHGDFHIEQNSSGVWIRHPSDAVIPDSGEYASAFGASGGTGTYDPQVPVARDDLSGGVSSTVTLDDDMVMCLSCHRPHGSPYPDMLRWDYDGMVAGGSGSGGCFQCHTRKN